MYFHFESKGEIGEKCGLFAVLQASRMIDAISVFGNFYPVYRVMCVCAFTLGQLNGLVKCAESCSNKLHL